MLKVHYGGKSARPYSLREAKDLLVVRTARRATLARTALTREARALVDCLEPIARFAEAGVEILRCDRRTRRDDARAQLKREPELQFAGRVLADPRSGVPIVYTENLFVKFDDEVRASECRKVLGAAKVKVKRNLDYVRNGYFVEAQAGTGQAVFDVAAELLGQDQVELCHPELVRELRHRGAFPGQWHLEAMTVNGFRIDGHASVSAAWSASRGEGITIAVIDDGFDLTHEEFRSAGKIVAPRDVTRGNDDPSPGRGDDHGTACAGVACADGSFGASGVAPAARLMPIRLASGLGSQAEADAFVWAARNGADVISCSWGPPDGNWWDDNDPTHRQRVPLPDQTRLAIDWAVRNGRGGRGCVITWAAGNGNESVDNDGYASYDKVVAVAACNERATRSAYSDMGDALWCAFPSNDTVSTLTPGIWTTDRSGRDGYNPGRDTAGDAAGHYTNSFGGTSSACPGVAGVAALVLARNPELRWDEVKNLLKAASERIDTANGAYDANGHSRLYGFGRVNARKAVELAVPPRPAYAAVHTAIQTVPIEDLSTASLAVEVGDDRPLRTVAISVDIAHTYIGDLTVTIEPPPATGVGPVMLHQRTGAGEDDIRRTYDFLAAPGLSALVGKSPRGTWTLRVRDHAREDTGAIRSMSVRVEF
ncbi:MAG: S8 family serine peptidase [Ectothiorhodospiraceae bacterium]|nr:S8 family serine peptidase [Ectothiorhodospiraceae bacterium]